MDKVSMSYLFSITRYQTKRVTQFLFRQLMTNFWLLSTNITKCQTHSICRWIVLPANCLSVFDHFAGLALRRLRFILDQALKQWLKGSKWGEDGIQKFEYCENEKSFFDEIKNFFHSFWKAITWWEIKICYKIANTSFSFQENVI